MANISEYTNQIRGARYGEEVRGSIVNAIEAINDEVVRDTESAGTYASEAQTAKTETEAIANGLRGTLTQLQNMSDQLNQSESVRTTQEQTRQNAEEVRQQNEERRENEGYGYVAQAKAEADRAAGYANSNYSLLAESWAVGNTGTRMGEDTDNAKYWAQQAAAIATGDGVVTFNGRNGIVVPESGDYSSDKISHGSGTVNSALEGVISSVNAALARVNTLDIDVQNLNTNVNLMSEDFLKADTKSEYIHSAVRRTLKRKDTDNEFIYPFTKASAVYTNNGEDNVENKLSSMLSQITDNSGNIESILNSLAYLPELSYNSASPRSTFYAKFPSGLLVCGIFLVYTCAVDVMWESLFYSDPAIQFGNWPLEFTGLPYFITSCSGVNVILGGTSGVSKTKAGGCHLYSAKSQPSTSYYINIIGIGKWK